MRDFKEIPYKIEFKKETYFKDFMKWYKFKKMKRWIIISALFITSLLLYLKVDTSFTILFLIFSASFFFLEIYDFIIHRENIIDGQMSFFYKEGTLTIKPTSFKFSLNETYYQELFFSQIEKVIDFNDVIFFNLKAKGLYPYKLNKSEISSLCYSEIIKTLKKKKIKIIKSKK